MKKIHAFRSFPILLSAMTLAFLPGVASALTVKSFYPANGAVGQCLDTPLRMVLSGKAVMNWGGSIRIRNVATNAVVATWTLDSNPGDPQTTAVNTTWPWQDSVGYMKRMVWPVVLDSIPSYLAEIRVPTHLLRANTEYQVEVDAGVLKGSDGSSFPGVAAGAWKFTTGSAPVPKSTIVVASDNSGDVCSIQEGLDLVSTSSKTTVQVLVRSGYYREMFTAGGKNHLELYGAGVDSTIVRYFDNNNLNPGSSTRALAVLGGNSISIRAISIVNTVNTTGGQAEALYLSKGDSAVVSDVFLHGFQDTWLNSGGTAYVQNSTIEGSTDFVWGYNPTFFKKCKLVYDNAGSVNVQPRNDSLHHGYVFDSCSIRPKASGYSGCAFARNLGYTHPEVMFLHTTLYDPSIFAADPWTISGTGVSVDRLCEYESVDSTGKIVSITNAQRKIQQCSADSASKHESPAFVLGWTPSVPSLSSVLALTARASTTGIAMTGPPASVAGPRARLLAPSGSESRLELLDPGYATVREILPDGSTREIFHGKAPCVVGWTSRGSGLSWIEVVQPQGRSVLAANGLRR